MSNESTPQDLDLLREQFLETAQAGSPRRHHFVPKFLLRNFANSTGSIALRRAESPEQTRLSHESNLAVAEDFYTWVNEDRQLVVGLENMLARVESDAAPAVRRLAIADPALTLPPSERERILLARFVAMQYVRTPRQRRVQEAIVDYVWKLDFERMQTNDDIRSQFEANGHEPSDEEVEVVAELVDNLPDYRAVAHQNDHIQSMLDVGYEATLQMLRRHLTVLLFDSPGLAMSDDPVVLIGGQAPGGGGPGIENCEFIGLPISREVALVFHNVAELPPFARSTWTASQWNHRTAASGALEFYFHPDDEDVIPTEFRTLEQPLFMVESNEGPTELTTDGVNHPPSRSIRPNRSNRLLNWNFEDNLDETN